MTGLGMSYTIRRVRPSDGTALEEFYAALSPETRRARFLGFGAGVGNALAQRFCTLDHVHEEGFVAVAPGPNGDIVGHLCLADAGEGRLEVGVAVSDGLQGGGLGRRLFEAALDWARDHRVQQLIASAFADNTRVLKLLSSAPHGARIEYQAGGVVDVTIPLIGPLPREMSLASTLVANPRRHRESTRGRRAACHYIWRRRPASGGSATIARSDTSSRH